MHRIILLIILLYALAACGSPSLKEKLDGVWETEDSIFRQGPQRVLFDMDALELRDITNGGFVNFTIVEEQDDTLVLMLPGGEVRIKFISEDTMTYSAYTGATFLYRRVE